jgi:hypothetical protein
LDPIDVEEQLLRDASRKWGAVGREDRRGGTGAMEPYPSHEKEGAYQNGHTNDD